MANEILEDIIEGKSFYYRPCLDKDATSVEVYFDPEGIEFESPDMVFQVKDGFDAAKKIIEDIVNKIDTTNDYDKIKNDLKNYFESHTETIETIDIEEDVWIKDERIKNLPPFYDEILKHKFENPPEQTVIFGLEYGHKNESDDFSPSLRFEFLDKSQDPIDFYNVPQNSDLKKTVENIIKHFTNTQVDKNKMDLYIKEQVKSLHESAQTTPQPPSVSERENKTAKKAGYVQGVCECIAAMFGDKSMGKKLLSEMQVTKEMAKKYANPETYKTLEEGIFAPNQEQQQSRGRGM